MSWWWLLLVPVAYVIGMSHGLFLHNECVNFIGSFLNAIDGLLNSFSSKASEDVIDCEYKEVK